ncbi:PNGase F N-terminal domain-containing protein [Persicobacter diffluens]|uniref:PNGase F N-terminal domain-containing protein n=1 Tax=Persicobacter diffluens TaxID=981 RepID=UPI0030C727E6
MNRYFSVLYIFLFFLTQSCGPKEYPAVGNLSLKIFDQQSVCFNTELGDLKQEEGLLRLDNGRIVLKKVQLPAYQRKAKAQLKVTLQSNGDRWDKSGSLFMFPADQEVNLISIKEGKAVFPASAGISEDFPGLLPAKGYAPAMELMRFMTPFGVGYYSQDTVGRKPAYIDHWENEVVWEQDISDRLPALMGKEVYVGVWIDTWTPQGYQLSAELEIKEAYLANDVMPKTYAAPIFNSIAYFGPQQPFDYLSRQEAEFDFEVPAGLKNIKIHYIITGHGGHSGGDEFVPNPNKVYVDGELKWDWIPWRTDCAAFRRFNPSSGIWMEEVKEAQWLDWEKRQYVSGTIQERVASSDYSRSNWCPGSVVDPVGIYLGDLSAGKHQLKISLPESQPTKEGEHNHWLISAYLTGSF